MGNIYKESFNTAKDIEIYEGIRIQNSVHNISFKTLVTKLENWDFVIPDFSQVYRWTEQQAEQLVISLLRGFPIPSIYCYTNKAGQQVILDGKQRVISLYLYYIDKFMENTTQFINQKVMQRNGKSFRDCIELCNLRDKRYYTRFWSEKENDNGNSNWEVKTTEITYSKLSQPVKDRIDFSQVTMIQINVDCKNEHYRLATLHKIAANLNVKSKPWERMVVCKPLNYFSQAIQFY